MVIDMLVDLCAVLFVVLKAVVYVKLRQVVKRVLKIIDCSVILLVSPAAK